VGVRRGLRDVPDVGADIGALAVVAGARVSDWYEENIEEGVRDAVRLLRNNGINTTYSCHCAMVIEAENYEDVEMGRVYDLLTKNGYDDFRLSMVLMKEAGQRPQRCLHIKLDINKEQGDALD
jgi:hypothetical protein